MKSIIWLHNVLTQGAEFEALSLAMHERGYHNVHFHPPYDPISFEKLFSLINKCALSSQEDKVYFVAYSEAAYLALTYMALNPDHVDRVFLINPILFLSKPLSKFWSQLIHTPFIGKMLLFPTTPSKSQDYIKKIFHPQSVMGKVEERLKPYLQSAEAWQSTAFYESMSRDFPLSEEIKSYPIHIYALFGEADLVGENESQMRYLNNFIHFSKNIISEGGHALPWSHPDLILKEMTTFLRD